MTNTLFANKARNFEKCNRSKILIIFVPKIYAFILRLISSSQNEESSDKRMHWSNLACGAKKTP